MDENLNTAAVTEDTTPQTETVEGADTPSVPENVDNPTTEPQTDTIPEADGGEENPQPPVEPFLTAKFKHKAVDLTREQTLAYAQKGMKYDEERPMMEDLALMAAAQGKSTAEFIRALKEADEAGLLEDKLNITGGDREAADILVAAEMEKRRAALGLRAKEEAEAEQKTEQATLDRLAGELVELKELVPEMADWDAIPNAVKEDAIKNNRNLTDAYLRYMHSEAKKIEQSRADAAAAAAASTGSQADRPPASGVDPAIAAMRRAIRDA